MSLAARSGDSLLRPIIFGLAASLLLFFIAGAAPSRAATISAVSVALDPSNSSDLFNDFPATSEIRESAASVLASDSTSFSTRYVLAVGTDIGNAGTLTVDHVASYTITFTVAAGASESWQVDLLSSWSGALTLVNDGSGPASVSLGGLSATHGGVGTLGGSLDLAAVPTLSSNAGGNTPFAESQGAVILGTGAGSVTLTFGFVASSTSTRGFFGGNRGDEGGLRMGIDTAMSAYSADDYPGAGGRTLADDGHFVSATLTTLVPEPAPLALALSCAVGLLAGGRRHRRPER